MIEQCKKCARARNQVNGRYCYSLWRYVEHDDDDEAYVYMVGWINEQYHKILKEFDKENDR